MKCFLSLIPFLGALQVLAAPPAPKLTWAPPVLEHPKTVTFPASGVLNLNPNQDYIIDAGSSPHTKALSINGGRNWICLGLQVEIPNQPRTRQIKGVLYSDISARRGLKIAGTTGVAHLEGYLFRGADLSEGIQIYSPHGIVQLQNGRIENMHAQDEVNFADNHPDLIQTVGGAGELRVDRLTGETDYQGVLLKNDANEFGQGPVAFKNLQIKGTPTARYQFWLAPNGKPFGPVTLENVWADVPDAKNNALGKAVWPDKAGTFPNRAIITIVDGREQATWPPQMTPVVSGFIREGAPPTGDIVRAEAVGIGYVSPGYADHAPQNQR